MNRSGIAMLFSLALAACGGSPGRPVTNMPSICEDAVDLEDAEECAGWLVDRIMTDVLGTYDDSELLEYVVSVARPIARAAGMKDKSWKVRILDDPQPQAWAGPGGHVYVARGILARLGTEAELAGLLGHELAHIAAGHIETMLDQLPEPAVAYSQWSAIFKLAQDDEAQADQLAVVYLRRAGYDPNAFLSVLSIFRENEGLEDEEDELDWAYRHPPLSVRLALTARAVDGPVSGRIERARYLKHVEGLVVSRGFALGKIVGQSLVHTSGGFSFRLPSGWTLDKAEPNESGQIARTWSRGEHSEVLFMQLGKSNGFLSEAFKVAMEERSTRQTQLAGFEALIGTIDTEREGNDENRAQVALFTARDGNSYILFVRDTEDGEDSSAALFQELSQSFRREHGAPEPPLRVRLMQVPHDTTLAQLVAEGCAPDGESEIVSMLNGKALDAPLLAGETIKCVDR